MTKKNQSSILLILGLIVVVLLNIVFRRTDLYTIELSKIYLFFNTIIVFILSGVLPRSKISKQLYLYLLIIGIPICLGLISYLFILL